MSYSDKFLDCVAAYYMSRSRDNRDTVLLFPNKRAILFMRTYLKRHLNGVAILPKMQTIGAYLATLTDKAEASHIEQLFTLYDAYYKIASEHGQTPMTFDRFRFWGEILLGDIDDIDRQMADARDVFLNVKRYEEIRTDFLEEDQRRVAKEIWGYEPASFEGFRSNMVPKDDDDIAYQGYVRLSEMLYPVYNEFHKLLGQKGLSTRGMIMRAAAENFDNFIDIPGFLPKRFGIIGFGVISQCERKIFKTLQNVKKADFFWNIPEMLTGHLPDYLSSYRSPLKKYISKITDYFEMPKDFGCIGDESLPEIKIISSPANTMQAKITGNILDELEKEGILRPKIMDNTVIVLPSPSLLMPLLHSINVSPVNVTLGLPIRHTPFATLLRLIIKLNMSEREQGEPGNAVFLTQNVIQVISHPSLTALLPEETAVLRDHLHREGRFLTSLKTINKVAPRLAFIFDPMPDDESAMHAKEYLTTLIDRMLELIAAPKDGDSEKSRPSKLHEYLVLSAMKSAMENLIAIIEEHPLVKIEDNLGKLSFFRLVEKQLFHEQINFKGSPLVGVQIMGALETRSLDFDNVIMLSMNEKTFPPKHFMRSLIPVSIRAGYGLSTPEERELEFAWIYAGLLSRCRKAFIVYDSSAEAEGKGGISRYLLQTKYIYNRPQPQVVNLVPGGIPVNPETISVKKTPEIMDEMKRFLKGGSSGLSVSALEKYGECPLKFYLSKVKNIPEPPKTEDAIDDATIGSVVHKTLQDIYGIVVEEYNGCVDKNFNIGGDRVRKLFTDNLNNGWYYGDFSGYDSMPHEAQLQIDLWTPKIMRIIECEKNIAEKKKRKPYLHVCCEMSPADVTGEKYFDWALTPELSIRFTFFIDRVDRIDENTLRFVDYKTGSDKLKVKSIENLFWQKTDDDDINPESNKAIFQLLTYGFAYKALMEKTGTPYTGDIEFEITKVLKPEDSIGKNLAVGDEVITSFNIPISDVFYEKLKDLVTEIFNPEVPFSQTPYLDNCLYCQFKNICKRNPKKKF